MWQYGADRFSGGDIATHFFFLHGLFPDFINSRVVPGGWSIAVEMMFYCFVPFLFVKITSGNRAIGFTATTLLFSIILNRYFERHPTVSDTRLWPDFLYFYLPNQLPIFGLGFVLFFLIRNQPIRLYPLVIVGAAGLFFVLYVLGLFPQHVLIAMGLTLFIYGLSRDETSVLVNRFTVFLGKISYSLYLSHIGVLYWMYRLDYIDFVSNSLASYALRFVILLLASSLVSYALYRVVKVPCQNLGKQLIKRLDRKNKVLVTS